MFSVIVCSIDPDRLARISAMYQRLLDHEPWELIHIGDAKSLAEGYNRGVSASRGEHLIFSHDDIDILSPQFAARLRRHLDRFDVVGLVGTSRLTGPEWGWAGPPHLFGQVAQPHKSGKIAVYSLGAPAPVIGGIQAIDGLFIAARRSVFSSVQFDAASFDGFHLYDLDFSHAAWHAGLRVAVACDICAYHASTGNFDQTWSAYAEKFHLKWLADRPRLPRKQFIGCHVAVDTLEQALDTMTPRYWPSDPAFSLMSEP